MSPPNTEHSSVEVAAGTGGVLASLGILTFVLFPFALPGLLVFVVVPLALIAVPVLVLAALVVVPLWLVQRSRRRLRRRRDRSRREDRLDAQRAASSPGLA